MSPENGSSSNLRFVIRFGQLLAQCNSDWQMKHSPNGGFKFFLSFLRNPRVRLKASCLLLSKVFLEKQNDRIYFWSPFLNFIKSEDVFPINTFRLEKKHFFR